MSPTEYDQLAEFLGRRFTETDRRFDHLDGQVAELRREILAHDLAELKQQVSALQSRTEEIEAQLSR